MPGNPKPATTNLSKPMMFQCPYLQKLNKEKNNIKTPEAALDCSTPQYLLFYIRSEMEKRFQPTP